MKKLLACLLVGFATQTGVLAQTTFSAAYNFTTGNNTNSFPYNGTLVTNVTIGAMIKSAGINTTAGSPINSFRATSWTTNNAFDPSEYIGFTVTAHPGFQLNISNLSFGVNRSTNGPRVFEWRASTNGFVSSVVLTTYTAVNTNFSQSGGVLSLTNFSATNAVNYLGMSVDASSFGALTNVEFRLYAYSANANTGAGGLGGNFTFAGSVAALGGDEVVWYGDGVNPGGAGTWSDTGTNWFDTATSTVGVWNPAKTARFGQVSGPVVVAGGGVTASKDTIFTDNYALTGGAINLQSGTNSITVDQFSVTADITSELTGTNALLNKEGPGLLVLRGSNSFSGGVEVGAGLLWVGEDAALGQLTNPLVLAGGSLAVTSNVTLGASRPVSGAGGFNVEGGKLLTLSGPVSNTATTLENSGTLHLSGLVRSLGDLAFAAPGVLSSSGTVSLTSLSTAAVTNGLVNLQANLSFPTGDQTIVTASNVTVQVNGSFSGLGTGRILKTGAGTLVLNSSNAVGAIRVGAAGAVPVHGGTFIVNNAAATGSGQAQLQDGLLRTDVSGGLVLANGLSIAGRAGAVAVLGGTEPLTFGGTNDFFASSGTSGDLRLDVNNTTIFNGPWAGVSGDGTADAIVIGGSGLLVLNGNASSITLATTLSGSATLELNTTLGAPLLIDSSASLTGDGTVAGNLTVNGVLAPGTGDSRGNITSLGTLSVPGFTLIRLFSNGINDQISAAGGLGLPGTLQVVGEPSWTPAIGDTFPLVGFGTITTAPTLVLPTLTNTNLVWNTNQFLDSGIIEVADANPLPPNYANWLTNYPSIVPPEDEGTADPDGDGYDNFTEFALDGNPTVPGFVGMTGRQQGTNAVFNWIQRKNPPGGVSYVIKRAADVSTGPWVNAADLVISNAADQSGVLLPAEYERKEFRVPSTNRSFYFLEGKITP